MTPTQKGKRWVDADPLKQKRQRTGVLMHWEITLEQSNQPELSMIVMYFIFFKSLKKRLNFMPLESWIYWRKQNYDIVKVLFFYIFSACQLLPYIPSPEKGAWKIEKKQLFLMCLNVLRFIMHYRQVLGRYRSFLVGECAMTCIFMYYFWLWFMSIEKQNDPFGKALQHQGWYKKDWSLQNVASHSVVQIWVRSLVTGH